MQNLNHPSHDKHIWHQKGNHSFASSVEPCMWHLYNTVHSQVHGSQKTLQVWGRENPCTEMIEKKQVYGIDITAVYPVGGSDAQVNKQRYMHIPCLMHILHPVTFICYLIHPYFLFSSAPVELNIPCKLLHVPIPHSTKKQMIIN